MLLRFREATLSDVPQLLPLLALFECPDAPSPDALRTEGFLAAIQKIPGARVYVAERQTEIVAMLECFILPNLGHYGMPSAVIEDVAVRADCQGQGIGHQMLHFALEQCKAAGCYKAVLSSSLRRERAHEFYEALGFERYGVCFAINPITADLSPEENSNDVIQSEGSAT